MMREVRWWPDHLCGKGHNVRHETPHLHQQRIVGRARDTTIFKKKGKKFSDGRISDPTIPWLCTCQWRNQEQPALQPHRNRQALWGSLGIEFGLGAGRMHVTGRIWGTDNKVALAWDAEAEP